MCSASSKSKKHKNCETPSKIFKKIPFLKLAKATGFYCRKSKKLNPKFLVIGFIQMIAQGNISFSNWAYHINLLSGSLVSKQALHKKVNQAFVEYCLRVLHQLMINIISKAQQDNKIIKGTLSKFRNVYIQDSTTFKLPVSLSWCYPGTIVKGALTSQLKIQTIYELKNNLFKYFKITSFRVNDQSCTNDILSIVKHNDLVIRDMGYFNLLCFKKLINKGVSIISKVKYGVVMLDEKTGKRIDIIKLMKGKSKIEKWIFLGKEDKVRVRLLINRVHPITASERKRKASKDRNKKKNHSNDYYKNLDFSILITNTESKDISIDQAFILYSLRWRIETIFKSWKSYNNLQKVIPTYNKLSKDRVDSIIVLSLINIVIQHRMYQVAILYNNNLGYVNQISLFKFIDYFKKEIIDMLSNPIINIKKLVENCKYEKRNDRINYFNKLAL
ncbi:MAG: IS4 family transposase [Saprospiraceae bacterium]|nr:IS4 family transposase [Saprospiraceae bacterium]